MTRLGYQIYFGLLFGVRQPTNFYFTDASGLTVAEVNDFRRECFKNGIEYKVVKNTLIVKALETLDADMSALNDTALKGFTGIMFAGEASNAPAKVIKD